MRLAVAAAVADATAGVGGGVGDLPIYMTVQADEEEEEKERKKERERMVFQSLQKGGTEELEKRGRDGFTGQFCWCLFSTVLVFLLHFFWSPGGTFLLPA